MDIEEQIELIDNLIEEIEPGLRERLANIAIKYGVPTSINVATSLGTSLLAIALMPIKDEERDIVLALMMRSVQQKTKEGSAAMEAELIIKQAKGELE